MHQIRVLSLIAGVLLIGCAPEAPQETTTTTPGAMTDEAPTTLGVELALSDQLDGVTNLYCLDIAGGNRNVDVSRGLQAHTCYSYRGELGSDQTFDPGQFDANILYMPGYDVCVTLEDLRAGASVGLAPCDGSESQAVAFSGNGTIRPLAASDLCFTAADESRFGRAEIHQIKDLTLEPCRDERQAYQTWRARTSMD